MIVRCGSCRSQFDVPGPGRHGCPACGAVNQVGGLGPGPGSPGGLVTPPGRDVDEPARPETAPSRAECGECSFSFIVGDVDVAVCPNCNAEVEIGGDE